MNKLFLHRDPRASPLQGWNTRGIAGGLRGMWPGWDSYSPLSVSLVVAQRLRKLDFPVKDSEEPSTPGADKNHFLRPRDPERTLGR